MPDEKSITRFSGQYRFLSNFYPLKEGVLLADLVYPTVEHAYQASKTVNVMQRRLIQQAFSPGEAKRLGKKVSMRPEFEDIKVQVMLRLVRQKFKNPFLANILVATGDRVLVEGNDWGDQFWGESPVGTGKNKLGKILMKVRKETRV